MSQVLCVINLCKWIRRYAEKIDKLAEKIYDKAAEISKCRPDEFNVINHGDFWVNNMMFRYNEEGKPIDHIFVSITIRFTFVVYHSL